MSFLTSEASLRTSYPLMRAAPPDGRSTVDSIFTVVVRVDRALRDTGHTDQAEEFLERAVNCPTYAELVRLAREHVDIKEGTPHS